MKSTFTVAVIALVAKAIQLDAQSQAETQVQAQTHTLA